MIWKDFACKRILIILLILIVLIPCTAFSRSRKTYGSFEKVKFIRNYDGDTITVDILDVPSILGDDIPVRIYGIDTPEIKGKCEREKVLARKAKRLVYSILSKAKKIMLKNVRRGKYFRIVATVEADGVNVADVLLQNGLAVPYYGGRKKNIWCRR